MAGMLRAVRDAIAVPARSFKRVSVDRHARDAGRRRPRGRGHRAVEADLAHVDYGAGAGCRMDESAGDDISSTVAEISARVHEVPDRQAGESFVEAAQQPVLWNEQERARQDPSDYPALARRAALTILRIVELDCAGWDLQAMQETFSRLIEQLLDRLRRVGGAHAGAFRLAVAAWLADPPRLDRVVRLAPGTASEKPLSAWLQLRAEMPRPGVPRSWWRRTGTRCSSSTTPASSFGSPAS